MKRIIRQQEFPALNQEFRRAYKKAINTRLKNQRVCVTIEGIRDNMEDTYPLIEISNRHVSYYSVERQGSVVITDKPMKATIYITEF